MGSGRPLTQGPPAPLAASAESGPCLRPRRAPSSPQARAVRRSRSPVLRCRPRPAVATSDSTRVGGPSLAGRAPARKSTVFQGGSGLLLRVSDSVRISTPAPGTGSTAPLCLLRLPRSVIAGCPEAKFGICG
ncbi:hypothetical protein NDU88_007272 [Pleurodeles waltl]|uniref:Uncharacterized protein n=1 Tax=Pleurodeles waltl TaxID=8319 RepID=A0AAV7RNZ5_PLEWA|nr:hypothetical protein NDU88_007272 [Pleurodeles waltl]